MVPAEQDRSRKENFRHAIKIFIKKVLHEEKPRDCQCIYLAPGGTTTYRNRWSQGHWPSTLMGGAAPCSGTPTHGQHCHTQCKTSSGVVLYNLPQDWPLGICPLWSKTPWRDPTDSHRVFRVNLRYWNDWNCLQSISAQESTRWCKTRSASRSTKVLHAQDASLCQRTQILKASSHTMKQWLLRLPWDTQRQGKSLPRT